MLRLWCLLLILTMSLRAQIPSQEDLETKSKRDSYQEGLEMREVRESSAKDAGEALAKLEGVWKLRKGAIANDVVLRGFQGGNLNLLIDGLRIYGACPGDMDPAAFHVDFAEIERIEVTKGAFDITNPGAMGGTVNIVRKRGAGGLRVTPSLQVGSFGYYNPALTSSYGNDRFEVLGGYSYRTSLPFRDGQGNRMTSVGGYRPAYMDDDAFRIHTGWAEVRFSPKQHQWAELGYTRQDGNNILYPYLQMDAPYDNADRVHLDYTVDALAGTVRAIRLRSYYSRVRHWMTDEKRLTSVTALDTFGMATFAATRAIGGRAEVEVGKNLVVGFESYQRNWDAVNSFRTRMMNTDQNIIPNVNTTVAGGFADYNRSPTDRLRIGLGVRLDTGYSYLRSQNVNQKLYLAYQGVAPDPRRDTNPSANARIAYRLGESLEWFAGLGSNVRLPDAQERYYAHQRPGSDWVGNPVLNPSRNTEANLGLNFRRKRLYVKPLVYYSRLDDFVVVHNQSRMTAVPGVINSMARSYENVTARMYGGEVSYGAGISRNWMLGGGVSYTRGLKDALPARNIFSTNLAEIPPLRARSSLRYGTRLWFAEVEGVASAAQRRVDSDLRESPTPSYAVMNLKCGLHAKRLTVVLGLDNVFDRYYVEHFSYQRDPFRNGVRVAEPGRNVFVNAAYAF